MWGPPGTQPCHALDPMCILQTGPVDDEMFLKAAVEGNIKVVEKFLTDGGPVDTCDQVRYSLPCFQFLEAKQSHDLLRTELEVSPCTTVYSSQMKQ